MGTIRDTIMGTIITKTGYKVPLRKNGNVKEVKLEGIPRGAGRRRVSTASYLPLLEAVLFGPHFKFGIKARLAGLWMALDFARWG